MFGSLIESRPERKAKPRLPVSIALGLHGAVFSAVLVHQLLHVPPIHEPPSRITFAQIALPPPPPPAPPSSPRPEPVPDQEPPEPEEFVELLEIPDTIDLKEIEPQIQEPDNSLLGHLKGVPGGVPGGLGDELALYAGGTLRVGGDVTAPVAVDLRQPNYPPLARRAGVVGAVVLEIVIHEDGRVGKIRVLQGLRFGCTEAAIQAVRRARFKPGMRNGRPVRVYWEQTFLFELM